MTNRINKYLALQNIATRRGADELVLKGLVFINGRKAVLGDKVGEHDKVEVKKHRQKSYFYFAYNKPVGVVTTTPTSKEKEILDIARFPTKVFPVGRLDKDSHGLIIFTNDGRITDKLLHPGYVHEKEYLVSVDGEFPDNFLIKLNKGVKIDTPAGRYQTKPTETKRIGKNSFRIILTEGKKRQIRRMCEALDYRVRDLKRTRVMNIKLGDLRENAFRPIEGPELQKFLDLLFKQ